MQAAVRLIAALFLTYNIRTLHHRLHFPECHLARQVFHAAIGRDHNVTGGSMRQRLTDPRGDNLGSLDGYIGQIEDTKDDGF